MTAARQYITAVSSASGMTTYNFAGVALGTPAADRRIVLCAETRKTGGGLCEITACTVGGITATPVVQNASADSGTVNYAGILIADVPSGVTGDISVTFSLPVLRAGVQVYAVTGEVHQSGWSLADHPTVALDVPAGGFAVGCLSVASSQSFSWSGLDEDHIELISGSLRAASASREYSAGAAGQTLAIVRNAGSWSSPVGVFATWGPAGAAAPSLAHKRRLAAARRKYR